MDNAPFLRAALGANALFTVGSGALAVTFHERVAEMLALPSWVATGTGVGLALYASGLLVLSRRRRVSPRWALGATALDLGWVAGSAALLTFHAVHSVLAVVVSAVAVGGVALLQLEGLRRALFTSGVGRYAIERVVNAPAERAWDVVSDVGRYAEVAGTLHRSEIISGSGVGMVRQCEDTNGICWLETCTRWEPGQAYAFEVDTSAPGYPLPLTTMRGDFEVDPIDRAHSTIRIRFAFSPRGGRFTEALLAVVFALRGDALVGGILVRWAKRIEAREN
jgi:ribosome-associated toxin RatA of RatAB toxin-antitoxin module